MNLSNCLYCIYYNLLSNFYISVSTFLPGFEQDIINLQYKTIQSINEDYVFAYNTRKRKRFNIFVENLVKRNNDFLEKIRQEEYEDNDPENYDKINDEECSNDSHDSHDSHNSHDSHGSHCDGDGECEQDIEDIVECDNDQDNSEYITEETIYEDDKKYN